MSSLASVLYATRIPFTYQNIGDKLKENSLKSQTLPFALFSLPENEAISFCYGLCDVTLIQLRTSITSNLAYVIG